MSIEVIHASAVTPLCVIGEQVRVLASAAETGGVEVFLQEGAEGIGPPPHRHAWSESYFVLEGELEVFIDGEARRLAAGDFVFVPAGALHGYVNRSARARFLSVTGAAGASSFFRAMHSEVSLPPDIAVVLGVATRNGVAIAPPPAE